MKTVQRHSETEGHVIDGRMCRGFLMNLFRDSFTKTQLDLFCGERQWVLKFNKNVTVCAVGKLPHLYITTTAFFLASNIWLCLTPEQIPLTIVVPQQLPNDLPAALAFRTSKELFSKGWRMCYVSASGGLSGWWSWKKHASTNNPKWEQSKCGIRSPDEKKACVKVF